MNYDDIKEHVDAGKTAATITTVLQGDTLHVRDIMAVDFDPNKTDLYDVLEQFELLDGSLDLTIAAQESDTLSKAWDKLKRHMQTVNRVIRCGSVAEIGLLTSTLTALGMATKPDKAAEIQAAMDELTGGLRYAGVTEAKVQTCIDVEARRQLIADTLEPIEQASGDAVAKLNNATAELSDGHTDGLTITELQARCEAVAASSDGLVGE